MKRYNFSVVIEYDKDGYVASCPELQGCYSQGETYEEALKNIKDAIRLHAEDRLSDKEKLPERDAVSLSTAGITLNASPRRHFSPAPQGAGGFLIRDRSPKAPRPPPAPPPPFLYS